MRLDEIRQADVGMLVSVYPLDGDAITCMNEFCQQNTGTGVPVQSAYDAFGNVMGYEQLVETFYQNVALSDWNQVKDRYDFGSYVNRLNEYRRGENMPELDEGRTALAFAGKALYLEQEGFSLEQVDRLLEQASEGTGLNQKYLKWAVDEHRHFSDDQVDLLLESGSPDTFPARCRYLREAGDQASLQGLHAIDEMKSLRVAQPMVTLLVANALSPGKALSMAKPMQDMIRVDGEEMAAQFLIRVENVKLYQKLSSKESEASVSDDFDKDSLPERYRDVVIDMERDRMAMMEYDSQQYQMWSEKLAPYQDLMDYALDDASEPELEDPEETTTDSKESEQEDSVQMRPETSRLASMLLKWAEEYDTYEFEDARDGKSMDELQHEVESELMDEKLCVDIYQYVKEARDEMKIDDPGVALSQGEYSFFMDTSELLERVETFVKEQGYDLSLAQQEAEVPAIDTSDVIRSMGTAQSMQNPQDFHFVSPSAGVQIDIQGLIIEPMWEDFTPSVAVYENGDLLYLRDAVNVDNYHQETYTRGRFASLDAVENYLKDTYGQVTDWEKATDWAKADVLTKGDGTLYPKRWENPSYARDYERMHSSRPEDYLDRIVFEDKGPARGRDGKSYHKVDFAYACDQKTFGKDENMPNPYLLDAKQKGKDGKLFTTHSYYLSDSIYRRLMNYANTTGLGASKWTGVIAAEVTYPTERVGQMKRSVNLTEKAVQDVKIATPAQPFDEKAHDKFVKRSMAAMYAAREKEKGTESRPLPTVSDRMESVQKSDKGLGED